jgi:hypothetical protein
MPNFNISKTRAGMKNITILIIGFLFIQYAQCQNPCLPDGFGFSTQEQIDSFSINYPECTEISGNIWIGGEELTNISNLNGFNQITTFGGSVSIINNPYLTSLDGLDNLTLIYGSFLVAQNDSLTDISALSNLTGIGGSFGFHGNDQMINLEGLNALELIGTNVWVSGNERLLTFQGLEGLMWIGGYLWINYNDSLISLEGLNNIESDSIESLLVSYNPFLSECHIESICDYLSDPSGSFEILVNAPGCNSSEEIVENCFTGNEESLTDPNLSIYPNPSELGVISLKLGNFQSNLHLVFFNSLGQEIYRQEVYGTETIINIENWQSGIYLCALYKHKNPIRMTKIVVINN